MHHLLNADTNVKTWERWCKKNQVNSFKTILRDAVDQKTVKNLVGCMSGRLGWKEAREWEGGGNVMKVVSKL